MIFNRWLIGMYNKFHPLPLSAPLTSLRWCKSRAKGDKHRQLLPRVVHLLVLGLASLVVLSACRNNPGPQPGGPINIPGLVYTKHARCRMECRHIDEEEIREIIAENNINGRKSDPVGNPCPTTAYEGYSQQKHLRIIIAKCETNWKVVTCIDLEHEFDCDCK
jgi:hypothetical protein